MKDIFTNIIKYRQWDPAVPCGSGSSLPYTEQLRETLPTFLVKHRIESMADIPCGDFSWMSQVDFPENFRYIGGDIVNFLIRKNQRKWPDKDFRVFDLTQDTLPDVDLLFCRDCLFHLSKNDIAKVFDNVLASNVKYVMTTSYLPGHSDNRDIVTGGFRPINLEEKPFNLPRAIDSLDDGPVGNITRRMCLWNKNDVRTALK
jgi:hypothetical protein